VGAGVTRDKRSGATQFNGYAVGARRYGAGLSSAATRGKVDRAGYRARELRKRTVKRISEKLKTKGK
jgi:hypothetical protein